MDLVKILLCVSHAVLISLCTHLPPPSQLQLNHSSSAPIMPNCINHVHSTQSPNACLPPQSCPHNAYCYHCTLPSPSAHLHLNCVYSSSNSCLPPRPCLFKPEHLSPTSTVFPQVQALISHPDHCGDPCLPGLVSTHPTPSYHHSTSLSHSQIILINPLFNLCICLSGSFNLLVGLPRKLHPVLVLCPYHLGFAGESFSTLPS